MAVAPSAAQPEDFGSAAAATWFEDAIKAGGALHACFAQAVKSVISEELRDDASPLANLPAPAVEAAETQFKQVDTTIAELAARVVQLESWEAALDKEYPWRKYERECDAHEWLAGWKRFGVDRDWVANAAEQLDDPAMANAMAALLNNPDNPEARRLKTAVSMRNAPKIGWKKLCLASFGGSADRFRAFVSDKAASEDAAVAAIARKILAFFLLLETQYVDLATTKSTSAVKIQAQREEMMPVMFTVVKAMKRRAKKASARKNLGIEVLKKEFLLDWQLGLTRLSAAPWARPHSGGGAADGGMPVKRFRAEGHGAGSSSAGLAPPPRPPPAPRSNPQHQQPKGGLGKKDPKGLASMVAEFSAAMWRQQPAAIQAMLDVKFAGAPEEKATARALLST